MTPLLFWDFLCLYYRWMDITVEMSKYKKRIMLARSLRCLCLRPDSHFISFIHPFIQLKVLSHNFSLCCFFSLPFFVFLWPVWHRPTCTTQWAALYVIFAFVYRTHTVLHVCVFSCRVVFFYFLHFHYKHFYGLHLMNRGQSIRPLSERAKEEVAWDKDWKASLLQTLHTLIHTYIVNVLCACTVKFHTFPFGQLTASLMLQFHSYYSPLSFCLMEFSAFSFSLDEMSVIRPFTIQYTLVLFCSTFKKMRLYLIFFSIHSDLHMGKHTGSYPSTKFISEILLHDRTIST